MHFFFFWSFILLSHYICFISFLCLDWYVLEDDASMRYGSFVQAKHLCVLIHIKVKGQLGIDNMFKPSSNIFVIYTSYLSLLFCLPVPCRLVITCWERADCVLCCLVFLSFSRMVSQVRCGTLLYQFLNFVFIFNLYMFISVFQLDTHFLEHL